MEICCWSFGDPKIAEMQCFFCGFLFVCFSNLVLHDDEGGGGAGGGGGGV